MYPVKNFFLLLLLSFPFVIQAQTITTIAGNGIAGYSGDNGPATVAKLHQPAFMCYDQFGNLLITDSYNNVVRKVNTSGIITTIAGNGNAGYSGDNGLATAAELRVPLGIAVDAMGNIYFAEYRNNVIRKINTAGIISTIAGNGVAGYSGDNGPATNAKLNLPYGLAIDKFGNIYFPEVLNYCVRKINTSGVISTIAGNGTYGFSGDGGSATAAQFRYPGGIAISDTGDIFVADYQNHRIRKINSAGIINTFAGNGTSGNTGDNGAATDAELNAPNSVYIDDDNNVYITDCYANIVRKVNTTGIITTIAGNGTVGYSGDNGPATLAQMSNPIGLCINKAGNIFVAEYDNNIIRKITYHNESVNNTNIQTVASIFPNPAHDELNIIARNKIGNLTISNLIGQIVLNRTYETETATVNIANLPPGVYTLKVTDNEGRKTITKFVKE